jgi:hypothetical protein
MKVMKLPMKIITPIFSRVGTVRLNISTDIFDKTLIVYRFALITQNDDKKLKISYETSSARSTLSSVSFRNELHMTNGLEKKVNG